MKIEMIDLVDFFNDKYRNFDNNLGIGATGIITEIQMVTRFNESPKIKGVGSHFETEGSILSDIFGFDKNLFLGFGYNQTLYNNLDENYKKVLGEVIVIKYINNSTGNLILIYLPLEQETLTLHQMEVIKYLSDYIEEVSYKINKPIKIMATNRHTKSVEINSLRNKIIPYFEKFINDTYKQSISDQKIIAKDEIKKKVKRNY